MPATLETKEPDFRNGSPIQDPEITAWIGPGEWIRTGAGPGRPVASQTAATIAALPAPIQYLCILTDF